MICVNKKFETYVRKHAKEHGLRIKDLPVGAIFQRIKQDPYGWATVRMSTLNKLADILKIEVHNIEGVETFPNWEMRTRK